MPQRTGRGRAQSRRRSSILFAIAGAVLVLAGALIVSAVVSHHNGDGSPSGPQAAVARATGRAFSSDVKQTCDLLRPILADARLIGGQSAPEPPIYGITPVHIDGVYQCDVKFQNNLGPSELSFSVTDTAKFPNNVLAGASCNYTGANHEDDAPDPSALAALADRVGPLHFCTAGSHEIVTDTSQRWIGVSHVSASSQYDQIGRYPIRAVLIKWLADSNFAGTV